MNKIYLIFLMLSFATIAEGQIDENAKTVMQEQFCAGTIVSISDNIGCYRLKGKKTGGMYGYCKLDNSYNPLFSNKAKSWSQDDTQEIYINSKCYTIIAPYFDFALPFSEHWAAVAKDKKWTYISKDGAFLCDFVLDAAYPFKNGKAKVRYGGSEFEIDINGKGLPNEIVLYPQGMKNNITSLTVNQLVDECQYEKALEFGNKYLSELLPKGKVFDLPKQDIFPIIRLIFATNGAKNHLMASFHRKLNELFHFYKTILTKRTFSYLQDSPILHYYDFINYYNNIKGEIEDKELRNQIEREDFKYAVVKFEDIYFNDSVKEISPSLRYLYFMMLGLSGDFEEVNEQAILLAEKNIRFEEDYDNAVLLAELKQYSSALSMLSKIVKNNNNSLLAGKCYHHMALVYSDLGMKDESFEYFQKSLSIYNQHKNSRDLKLDAMIGLLCNATHLNSGQYSKLFKEYKEEEIAYNIDLFSNLDTYTLNKRWGLSFFRINKALSTLLSHNEYSICYPDAYELTVFEKTILQDAQSTWHQDAKSSKNMSIISMLDKYSFIRKDYVGIDVFDLENDSVYYSIEPIFELERNIKKLLYKKTSIVSPYKYNCFKTIQNVLQKDEMAIEFFTFTDNDHMKKYGAWVITKEKEFPEYIYIMDEDLCSNYLAVFDFNKTQETIGQFFRSDFGSLIWGKFNNITNYKTVYFSPVDELGDIGIENIPFDKSAIGFITNAHRITSTKIIPSLKENNNDVLNTANLFGGLNYGLSLFASERGVSHSGYLKYSRLEVDEINEILKNICAIRKFVEKEGQKDIILNYNDNSPNIIHIATHGWQKRHITKKTFFIYQDRFNYYLQNTDLENEDWLLNSTGLCMSTNDNLSDSLDNILFASDIAKIKLNNTSIVVLSACNTIAGSNGSGYSCTLGLNYALERANVRNIICSLWNVNDQKTYEFMTLFYTKLVSCRNIYKAFKQSVSDMRDKYPNNPEIWSSFVLIEN